MIKGANQFSLSSSLNYSVQIHGGPIGLDLIDSGFSYARAHKFLLQGHPMY